MKEPVAAIEQNKLTVAKANEFILRARYDLSTLQLKIVLYIIAQIQKYDVDLPLITFSIQDFCRVCGIDENSGGNYRLIKDAVKQITDKSHWITLEDGRETVIRWIEKPYMDKYNGTITVKLDNDLKPFLMDLTGNFTLYEIWNIMRLKSKYAIRFYEFIKCKHFDEDAPYQFRQDLEELKAIVGAESYKTFSAFRERVLEPAIAEINTKTDKIVSYDALATGRKTNTLIIYVKTKSQLDIDTIHAEIDEFFNPIPTIESEVKKLDRIGW